MPFGPLRLLGFASEELLAPDVIHTIVGGAPSTKTVARRRDEEFTAVSWNIAYGRYLDRALEVLRHIGPDLCLLQEVDMHCRRSRFANVAAKLAESLGMYWVFAGEFQEIGQGRRGRPALTGQAILSRWRLEEPEAIPFSRQARLRWHANPLQPRRGARMALRASTFGIRVYDLHVESGKNDAFRRTQVHDVIAAEDARARDAAPVIVAGDFNCGRFGHAPLVEVLRAHGFRDPFNSHPGDRRTSNGRRHALDWIFVRRLAPVRAAIVNHNGASDHFPVVVHLRRET